MGELSKADANRLRNQYIQTLDATMKKIREEIDDMDFENTDKYIEMDLICFHTTYICMKAKVSLENMVFSSAED